MDNATFHKRQDIQDLIQEHHHTILWLPPYSPDLNPIEQVWSWMKGLRQGWRLDSIDDLFFLFYVDMCQFLISVGIDEIFDGSVKVEYIVENTQYLTIRSFLQTVKITLIGLSVNFVIILERIRVSF